ncbi:MAG: ISL3 family transposase, partial [Desulfamplus sp.]|nr:ISL3 family transposase [Desulfamplus sp.]
NRLVNYIQKESFKRTFTSIADEIGLLEKTVRDVFSDYISEALKGVQFATPRVLGIDEIFIHKKSRLVLTNIEKKTIVEMFNTRVQSQVISYLNSLKDKNHIEVVTMDMWKPYRDAMKEYLPQAKVVIDKFHITRMANNAMEDTRKNLREQLTPKERITLKNDRFHLLKRKQDLTNKEILLNETWFDQYPVLKHAYEAKEDFFNLWEHQDKSSAKDEYLRWKKSIPVDIQAFFKPVLTAMGNWETEIFNYFEHRYTNALTESMNSVIRFMNRMGRGYTFETLRGKVLLSQGLHKIERTLKSDTCPVPPKKLSSLKGIFEQSGEVQRRELSENFFNLEEPEQHSQYEDINYGVSISKLLGQEEKHSISD